ncbi:Mov34/MPN/PAD-1 family protein [Neobacillus sp. 3P2-tot-E-2]|uniref:Mov34/MPN/PAD-1 family protein n=1 Tax=Neobacillus sp. 3P2-tot-E-2 TaxID=3132212 RepID=UPI0039A06E2E
MLVQLGKIAILKSKYNGEVKDDMRRDEKESRLVYVTDEVTKDTKNLIADLPAEKGGALVGIPGSRVITGLIFDSKAKTTLSSYNPSRYLNQIVKKRELESGLEFKGIIHSHPSGMDHPSSTDVIEVRGSLNTNKHLEMFVAPIVTNNINCKKLKSHEIALGPKEKVSFFGGFRDSATKDQPNSYSRNNDFSLEELEVKIIPKQQFEDDIQNTCKLLGEDGQYKVVLFALENGEPFLTARIQMGDEKTEFLLTCDINYPVSAPRMLHSVLDDSREVHIQWDQKRASHYLMYAAIRKSLEENPYKVPHLKEETFDEEVVMNICNQTTPVGSQQPNDIFQNEVLPVEIIKEDRCSATEELITFHSSPPESIQINNEVTDTSQSKLRCEITFSGTDQKRVAIEVY